MNNRNLGHQIRVTAIARMIFATVFICAFIAALLVASGIDHALDLRVQLSVLGVFSVVAVVFYRASAVTGARLDYLRSEMQRSERKTITQKGDVVNG